MAPFVFLGDSFLGRSRKTWVLHAKKDWGKLRAL